ncbi:MAG TPA: glucose-1-phosphate adenylyltransferase [Firmicutes bacterium]|nr:glucose-1-phosphate adenylyltransferase [Bacillota bacterium]
MGKEIVAMLLAGGKGTRLESLTRKIAKPAVSFGGKYRIIDFPLSNCANSRIETVGVLTQYESVALNTYVGNGEKWGLNGVHSLTASLPPRQTEQGAAWYKGTADAIYQNLDFLESLNPEYVLILSGDHIYKMNYQLMLDDHKKNNADLTVAVLNVTVQEASRFGIMTTDDNMMITKFTEKPSKPTSTLASMGIYIFNYKVLKQALVFDAKQEKSDHDFGKDVIPYLLSKKKRLLAYRFDGYWKDVGTITSLWNANMDLIDDDAALDLYSLEDDLKIFSEDTNSVPQYVGKQAEVTNSMVNQGAIILGHVTHSVIFNEAVIEENATVIDSVIMPNVIVKKGAYINRAIVASAVVIEEGRRIDGGEDIFLVAN